MADVTIGREARIELSFELGGATLARLDYENWVHVEVGILAPPLGGQFRAMLERVDVHTLRDEVQRLHADLGATMKWQAIEGWIEIAATGDARGHFELACAVSTGGSYGSRLTFRTEVDQTDIASIIRQLERVCAQLDELFPAR